MNARFSLVAASALVMLSVAGSASAQDAKKMSFFVTSAGLGKGGDLGGLAGADAQC